MKNKTYQRYVWLAMAFLFTALIVHHVYHMQPVLTLQDSIEQLHSQITDSTAHDTTGQVMPVIRPK